VTGCDAQVYPPMSDQLRALGIELHEGYDAAQLDRYPADLVRGRQRHDARQARVEAILDRGLPYASGPQWLCENVLGTNGSSPSPGTHGKSTTASMLAWILEAAGSSPASSSAASRATSASRRATPARAFFVIEADEYDTAFFDKRSKFVWYRPRTAILATSNTTMPTSSRTSRHRDAVPPPRAHRPVAGLLVVNGHAVASSACSRAARGRRASASARQEVERGHGSTTTIRSTCCIEGRCRARCAGPHGRAQPQNALAAHRRRAPRRASPCRSRIEALARFEGVKRRMELRGSVERHHVYDDFAHHPTAFETTIAGLRARVGRRRASSRFRAALQHDEAGHDAGPPRSSLTGADLVFCYARGLGWDPAQRARPLGARAFVSTRLDRWSEAWPRSCGPATTCW
jgi:UDP-N-acetylmuramate: L-alanyl-gamma-D-glutamyl-meso-diaminopimelate ligase